MKLVQIEDKKLNKGRITYDLILLVALSLGCWLGFFSMFRPEMGPEIILPCIILFPVAAWFAGSKWNAGGQVLFYAVIAVALFYVVFYESAWNGFLVTANGILDTLDNRGLAGLINFTVTSKGDGSRLQMMALIPLFVMVSAIMGYSVSRRKPLPAFAVTGIIIVLGIALGGVPSAVYIVLLVMAWICLFASGASFGKLSVQSTILLVLIIVVLVFSAGDFHAFKWADSLKSNIITWEENLRYGGSNLEGLSKGDLRETHPLQYAETPVFSVTMDQGMPMYLRGFAGATYADGHWEETQASAYTGRYRGVNQWLSQFGFYQWCQQNSLYRLENDYKFANVTVSNLAASSKYVWLPYSAAVTGEILPDKIVYEGDNTPQNKGLRGDRKYKLKVFYGSMSRYSSSGAQKWLSEVSSAPDYEMYEDAEMAYRNFVYDHYLQLDSDTGKNLSFKTIKKDRTIEYTTYQIRKIFTEKYRYDQETKAAPAGKDPLEYFIKESRKGNDMHFATAAALMFRKAGIPARYAEGYYMSDNFLKLYSNLNNVTMEIPDSLNHAWVEVYADGIGWVPVEVVPGFFKMDKQETDEEEDTKTLQETEQQTYPEEVQVDSLPEKSQPAQSKESGIVRWIVLAVILLLILYEIIGRLVMLGSRNMQQLYRRMCRILGFAGLKIKNDPYESMDEISRKYDDRTGEKYSEIMRMIYRERFGNVKMTGDEIKNMHTYVKKLGRAVYSEQNLFRKFVMRWIKIIL